MLHGHVDQVTRSLASGWAADSARPDEPIAVSIFVDGSKAAEVVCDVPRSDLGQKGLYGRGAHGFAHTFDPPLSQDSAKKVCIRFAQAGEILGHGNVVFAPFQPAAEIVASPPMPAEQFVVRAPVDARSLIELFKLFDPSQGLYTLLCRLDFSEITADHVAYATGVPTAAPGRRWSAMAARDGLNNALHAAPFQRAILATVLRAFPERSRLLFLHIPKCAGSDLSLHLAMRYPSLEQRLMELAWTSVEQLFAALSAFAREVTFSDTIFVRGHTPLDFFIADDLIRPMDRVFTIVRDPVEIAISQINYILTRFSINIEAGVVERDTREWLRLLDLPGLPERLSPDFITRTAQRALVNPAIVEPNSMTRWLGGGDAEEIIGRLARHRVEITDTAHYSDWRAARWGVKAATRQNESIKFVTLADLTHKEIGYVSDLSRVDRILFSRIEDTLAAAGTPSITGGDLLELA